MKIARIIGTIWITVLSLFIATFLLAAYNSLFIFHNYNFAIIKELLGIILGSAIGFFYYGIIFWLAVVALICFLEITVLAFAGRSKSTIKLLLIAESLVIPVPIRVLGYYSRISYLVLVYCSLRNQ